MPKKTRSKNHSHGGVSRQGKVLKTKRKTKDIDEIQNHMIPLKAKELLNQAVDYDLPGLGQNYCLYCARHFINDSDLQHHIKSKVHKRRVKELQTEAFTSKEADQAAGIGNYETPRKIFVPSDPKSLYAMDIETTIMSNVLRPGYNPGNNKPFVKNNLAEQLKTFYGYRKNEQRFMEKPNPLPPPVFRAIKTTPLSSSSNISTSFPPLQRQTSSSLFNSGIQGQSPSLMSTASSSSSSSSFPGSMNNSNIPVKQEPSSPNIKPKPLSNLCNLSLSLLDKSVAPKPNCVDSNVSTNNQNNNISTQIDDISNFEDELFNDWGSIADKPSRPTSMPNNLSTDDYFVDEIIIDDDEEVQDQEEDDDEEPSAHTLTTTQSGSDTEFEDYSHTRSIDDDDDDDNDFDDSPNSKRQRTGHTQQSQTTIQQPYKVKWLTSDVEDHGPEFVKDFPHTKSMLDVFHSVFGLKKFRHNQREAVNAALEGYDCFVLMPTGGGKSLCYQLPAVLDQGVTFVVSPLRSLILDQKQKLLSLGVACTALTGDITKSEADEIYRELYKHVPGYKIVYITPEKIKHSEQLERLLKSLYDRNLLSRFVIDEAHCVSEYGHDFRPDYLNLGQLHVKYRNVKFILLTATATPRVKKDILHQMKITNAKLFIQSFNRSNLIYECRPKGTTDNALKKILTLIQADYKNQCGIIYCFSRNECEKTANYLASYKIKALAYHAGLNDSKRAQVQNQWANDDTCQVICATIAFGMGIDKPNVRYVIHLSMPKSIEGYYQESGRAGRDGAMSFCYLFYGYQDLVKMKRLIMSEVTMTSTKEAKKIRIDNLHRVYSYCLNNADCRRTLLLEYFGEAFSSQECKRIKATTCDNCRSVLKTKTLDCTQLSIDIVKLVTQLVGEGKKSRQNITLNQIIDILRGSKNKNIIEAKYDQLASYNSCSHMNKIDVERLLSKLILEGYLYQDIVVLQAHDSAVAYIRPGQRAHIVTNPAFQKSIKIELTICQQQASMSAEQKEKQKTPLDQLIDKCVQSLKDEFKRICNGVNASSILTDKVLNDMGKRMPRTKNDMLKITEVTEVKYNRHNLDRLLLITQNFADQREVMKREEEAALKATNTSIKPRKTNDDLNFDEDEDEENDGWLGKRKRGGSRGKTTGNRGRFSKKKTTGNRSAYFARKNAIAKRNRQPF
ncbi:unnamed protein product [Didymodactylos carnosus]|uniref:RecQ-like DNA helicase BLM n=1 Tax=Didymodactylos carnosus TaxID=1234261 RepID=A0A8S2CKS6_9BILA|nr:unnamed protein product [Didymodactylos carnosus]CAF3502911.1 unnamed protein product [Didymodactylos carnosus]